MTHPQILVTVDGLPVSGAFFDRLVSLTITDREGIRSDTLDLVFNDAPPHFQSPRRGAVVMVTILSGVGGFVGAYVVDRVEFSCLPYTITVKGHSADLRSEMKANKTKHWDDASVKDIVAEKAGDYGLEAKISDAVSGYVYEWIGQQDESDLHFLERLAERHGALFTIKNGSLLWLERGTGKTAGGTAIPPAVVLMPSIIEGSCRMSETDVDRFAKVKAYWQDRKGAKRQEVVVDADPEASGEHVLRDPYSSREEAESAARAAAREMMRGLVETSCSIIGRPALMAGQPVIYAGVRPLVDGREFILETVRHSFTKSGGLRTAFTGKLKAG
ncbi:phage late control D family protein [Antarcticimicrobium sediminis]|uniref:Late control protein D n=1 Tax=Antarcticimicrobium sediminis TaxID=2546227 RepID=A0A4R5EG26_9RHOB|nr:contractile injection system protein, VgrG/Pvc8 family [Antarcticimicrobium sediminis]TDE33177.1 late control protein D [Antarcticimicrobium sediminis]